MYRERDKGDVFIARGINTFCVEHYSADVAKRYNADEMINDAVVKTVWNH